MVMKPRPDQTCYTIAISKLARSKGDKSCCKKSPNFIDVCMLGNEEGRRVKLTPIEELL